MWGVLRDNTSKFIQNTLIPCGSNFVSETVASVKMYSNLAYIYSCQLFLTIIFNFIIDDSERNVLKLTIFYKNKWQTITLLNKTKPISCKVYTLEDNDVTQDIINKGLGTEFFGAKVTPKMLGYQGLNFSYMDANLEYKENDVIDFNESTGKKFD